MYYKRKYIKIFCLFNKIYFDHFFLKILFLKKIKNDYLGKCADFSKRKVYSQHTRYLYFYTFRSNIYNNDAWLQNNLLKNNAHRRVNTLDEDFLGLDQISIKMMHDDKKKIN